MKNFKATLEEVILNNLQNGFILHTLWSYIKVYCATLICWFPESLFFLNTYPVVILPEHNLSELFQETTNTKGMATVRVIQPTIRSIFHSVSYMTESLTFWLFSYHLVKETINFMDDFYYILLLWYLFGGPLRFPYLCKFALSYQINLQPYLKFSSLSKGYQ